MAAKETTPLSGEETTSAIEEAQKLYFGAFGLCACAGGAFAGVYSGTGNLGAAWGAASGLIFAAIGMVVYGYKLMSKAKEMTVAKVVVDEAKATKAKQLFFGAFGLLACSGGTFAGVYGGTGNLGAAFGGASGLFFAAIGMASYAGKLMDEAKAPPAEVKAPLAEP